MCFSTRTRCMPWGVEHTSSVQLVSCVGSAKLCVFFVLSKVEGPWLLLCIHSVLLSLAVVVVLVMFVAVFMVVVAVIVCRNKIVAIRNK